MTYRRSAGRGATLRFVLASAAIGTIACPMPPAHAQENQPGKKLTEAARPAEDSRDSTAGGESSIRLIEKEVAEHPTDPSPPTRLAAALLDQLKLTQDFTLYSRAEAACEEALKRDPKHVPAWIQIGLCYLGQNRLRDALEAAEQALAIAREEPGAIALRGDALLQLGQQTNARADYQKLLEIRPDLLAHARMANLHFAEADADATLASYEAALEAGEEQGASPALMAWVLVRFGEFHFRTGNWDEAERCYTEALELEDDDADALDHIAELHAARGEYEQALLLSERAIERSPRPEFFQARGDIYAIMGDAEEALLWNEKAFDAYLAATQAGQARYYHHLAALYCDVAALRSPADAIRWAMKDLQVRRTIHTLDAVAWALYHDGKYQEAAAQMDKALRQKTIDSHVLYHAGLIYARGSDPAKGRLYLRRAAAANPKFNEFHFHR